MKIITFGLSLAVALSLSAVAHAQRMTSPRVHVDRTVTFSIDAPNAKEVLLTSGFVEDGKIAMTKGEKGRWSVTVGPLAPEIYGYKISIDGRSSLDLNNAAGRLGRWPESVLIVRGDPPLLHEERDVTRGTVHVHWYSSKTLKLRRRFRVYTPPGYNAHAETPYPLLMLLHGSGDDDSTWNCLGRANVIADNLLAGGKMKPMVIVMPMGHAVTSDLGGGNRGGGRRDGLEVDLLGDILPLVEKQYHVARDRDRRGIVGLSMGGRQALGIGARHLDTFGWIGGFSSAIPRGELDETFAALKAKSNPPRLLWVGCGTSDFLFEQNKKFLAWLEKNEIPHVARITGGGHGWNVWRKYLAEFLPLMFQK